MAELVLSTLLPVVFEKLASVLENKIARSKGIHSELKKWEDKLPLIRAVLKDASEKEVTDEAVKLWLNRLQHLSYDIDDFLDGLATDAMQREFVNESQPITNKVRKFIPSCCTSFSLSTRVGSKLDDISTRLQNLLDEKEKLGLIVKNEGPKDKNRVYQTSLVDAKSIVGREGDKNELVQKLLADEPNFSIVPIFGMGGIGKTTLARVLYNDQLVQKHFELKAWVCVSNDFDSFKISKVIYQEVGGEQSKDLEDFNRLQVALKDRIKGKRFLLVLDDVWSEKLPDWEALAAPFSEVAHGSKIIITTRKQQLLNKLGCDHPYDLKELSPNDAFSLFARYAGINDFQSYPLLRPHGEAIVKKCNGLPLALQALGSLLRTKTKEEEWKRLLDDEIWMLEDDGGILPALRLSYEDLSACCKQLFAYCCLIPKDCVFEKNDLILLWMAEGFLHNSATNKTMECLGEEHFQELLSRSFFQHVPDDESLFVMHDLMNDLATFVAGEFYSRLDIDMEKNVWKEAFKKYRHMSFVCDEYITYNKFKPFERANSLRTFLPMPNVVRGDSRQTFSLSSKILVDILPHLPLLRVLSLSRLDIDEVPECVGDMKHLRYLNLSQNRITHLPESICNLDNLQTLIVYGCYNLIALPDNFLKLKNLRHFDIRDTPLWNMMPLGISEMKSLQILSNNIQELSIRFFSMIVSFPTGGQKLKPLRIDNYEQLFEKEVLLNTSMPPKLEVVHIERWNNLKSVDELHCFIHIKELEIRDCSSLESFHAAADLPNLTSLTHLTIVNCENMDIDSFGLWPPKLCFLEIGGLKKPITKWGPQNFPPSLVYLRLWSGSAEEDDVTSGSQFSHMLPSSLTNLCLYKFEKLESVSKGLQHLTSLQHLHFVSSPKMKDLPKELLSSLLSLFIKGCTDELKEKTSRRGSYWPLISNIPRVSID